MMRYHFGASAGGAASTFLFHLSRCGLAVAFLASGTIKLARPEVFAVTVKALGLVPDALAAPLSHLLPGIEVAAAVLLLADVRGSLTVIAGLLTLFVGILFYALRMGLDIDCGCYGPGEPEREAFSSIRTALWRDGAMLAVVAALYWLRRRRGWRGRSLSALLPANILKETS